jgi:hypothetical protein
MEFIFNQMDTENYGKKTYLPILSTNWLMFMEMQKINKAKGEN